MTVGELMKALRKLKRKLDVYVAGVAPGGLLPLRGVNEWTKSGQVHLIAYSSEFVPHPATLPEIKIKRRAKKKARATKARKK